MDSEFSDHHDRSPGEDPNQSAMDEDPQESLTLKNALQPLPDTQPSQLQNPEEHRQVSALQDERPGLISRPKDTDIDAAKSFVFGQPVKVIPGQFGRAIPPKPIKPVPEEPLDNHVPGVEDRLAANQPKVVPRDRGQAFSKPIPRRPLQIKHLPPRCSPSDHETQRPTPLTSSAHTAMIPWAYGDDARSPEAGSAHQYSYTDHQGRTDCTAVTQKGYMPLQNHQQDTVKTDAATTQTSKTNYRVSLPNDTSVSSPSTFHHSPHGASSRAVAQVNRPMRGLPRVSNTRTPTNRPTSRRSMPSSNIGKKRSVDHRYDLGTTKASLMALRRAMESQESPSIKRDEHPRTVELSPSSSLVSHCDPPVPCGLGLQTQQVTQVLNNLYQTYAKNEEQAQLNISRLDHIVQGQQCKLSRYKKEKEDTISFINELQKTQDDLQEQLDLANKELSNRSEKASKLEHKFRQYKEYLNSAVAEQQDLYRASNAKCEDAIKRMREAEDKQKILNAQERRQADAAREHFNEVVKSTIAECKSKECEFVDKIESLNQKLQRQEVHISQERETTQRLLQKDETLASVQETVRNMESQVNQIAANLVVSASRQAQQERTSAEATQSQLNKILERLSELDEHVPSTDIVQEIQQANAKTFSSILEHISGSQERAQADVQSLADGIEVYMEDFWMKLEDREDVLTELLEQVQADNEQLNTQLKLKHDEHNDLSARLSETETTIQEREKEIGELKQEISAVEHAQAAGMEELARANLLHDEYDKLKRDLDSKMTLASELQHRLRDSELALTAQRQEHARNTEQLRKVLAQRDREARESQEAAVELARKEVLLDMTKAKETMQSLLKHAKEERATLQDHLDTARQKISSMEEGDKRNSATVSELKGELQAAQCRAGDLGVEVSQTKLDHQKLQEQQSACIKDLEAKIADKKRDIGHLSKNAQAYEKQAQEVLGILKQWAQENKSVKQIVDRLEKAEHRDLDGIDSELKPWFEIDLLHKAIFQYFQAQEKHNSPSGNSQHSIGRRTEERQGALADTQADGLPDSTSELVPSQMTLRRIVDYARQVILRSPSGTTPSPRPPSVQTEQIRRRSAEPLKSIMKASIHNVSLEENDKVEQDSLIQDREISSQSAFTCKTHSRFASAKMHHKEQDHLRDQNLPSRGDLGSRTFRQAVASRDPRQDKQVVPEGSTDAGSKQNHGIFQHGRYSTQNGGTKPRFGNPGVRDQSHKSMPVVDIRIGQGTNTENAFPGGEPQKRRQPLSEEIGLPRKRTKTDTIMRGKSLFSTPPSQPQQPTEQEQDTLVPNAPHKKDHKLAKVASESYSPVRHPRQMNQTFDDALTGTRDLTEQRASNMQSKISKNTSQTPGAAYYHRRLSKRRQEESQDSMTHSQDVTRL